MIIQQIIHGDCRSVTDFSPFDVMIVDPPYGEKVHKNATSQSRGGGTRHRDLGFEHLSNELRTFISVAAANVKRWSLIYSDVEGLSDWRQECVKQNAKYIRTLVWVRWSMAQLSGDRPPQGFEPISLFWGSQKGKKSWNGPGNLTHLAHTCLRGAEKHKCEKPLDQILDLVTWFSSPGETIFDPCAGAGTVGLACKLLDRNYVGYEIDPVWAEKAQKRLESPLSERDELRRQKHVQSQIHEMQEKERIKSHTSKIRKKLDEDKKENDVK